MEGKVIPTDWKIFGGASVATTSRRAAAAAAARLAGRVVARGEPLDAGVPLVAEWTMERQVWQSDQPTFVYSSAEGELGGMTKMLPPADNATAMMNMSRSMSAADFFGGDGLAPYRYYQDEASALGAARSKTSSSTRFTRPPIRSTRSRCTSTPTA